jgi:hypothetical protein
MASANDQQGSAKRPGHLVDVSRDGELGPGDQPDGREDWEARIRPSSRQVSILADHEDREEPPPSAEPAQPNARQGDEACNQPAGSPTDDSETQDLDAFVAQLRQQPTARQHQQQFEADVDPFDQLAARQPTRAPAAPERQGTAAAPNDSSARQRGRRSPRGAGGHKTGRVLAGGLAVLILAGAGAAIATSGNGSRHQTPAATRAPVPAPGELGRVSDGVGELGRAAATADAQRIVRADAHGLVDEAQEVVRRARTVAAASRGHQRSHRSVAPASVTASDSSSSQTTPAPTVDTPAPAPPSSPSSEGSTSAPSDGPTSTSSPPNSGSGSTNKAFGYGGLLGSGHSGS